MDPTVARGAVPARETRLERLIEVGRALVAELNLEALLQAVLEAARELTGARYAALGVLDESRRELERFLAIGIDDETRQAIGDLPRGRGVLGLLIKDPRPIRIEDVSTHPQSYGFPPGHPPMRGFLGAPIIIRGEAFGNIYLTEKKGGNFDEYDEEAIVVLADWAAIAIANARAYGLVESRRKELEHAVAIAEATNDIALALAGETDLDRILELVVKRGRVLTDARLMLVMLNDGRDLVVSALAGDVGEDLLGMRVPIEGTIAGHVLRSGRSERLAETPAELQFALADRLGATAGLFVPLAMRGRALGVLAAFDRRRDNPAFTAGDERLLQAFAVSAAAGVATAQIAAAGALRQRIEAQERERGRWARELHDEALQELAALKMLLASARTADETTRREVLDQAAERIDAAVSSLRDLITDVRPSALDTLGLGPALESLVERMLKVFDVDVTLDLDLAYEAGRAPARLDPHVEETVYRIVQEASSNIGRHSGARRASVSVVEADGLIEVRIADEGIGFPVDAFHVGFGIAGMRERLELVDGTLHVESAPGKGTTVQATIPALYPPAEESIGA